MEPALGHVNQDIRGRGVTEVSVMLVLELASISIFNEKLLTISGIYVSVPE
jgi:hypothetical protein